MNNNALCGIDKNGRGTYTADGINALCEALKGSAVTSLRCAAPAKDGMPTSVRCLVWPTNVSSR